MDFMSSTTAYLKGPPMKTLLDHTYHLMFTVLLGLQEVREITKEPTNKQTNKEENRTET